MHKYTWLEKKLHQFALSSQFMREVTFEFESKNIHKKIVTENHVFIIGLARGGSLSYSDMPFVLAPNFWSKIYFYKRDLDFKERLHGDGIKFSTNSPEAFEEVFWKTFVDDEEIEEKFKIFVRNVLYKYAI